MSTMPTGLDHERKAARRAPGHEATRSRPEDQGELGSGRVSIGPAQVVELLLFYQQASEVVASPRARLEGND